VPVVTLLPIADALVALPRLIACAGGVASGVVVTCLAARRCQALPAVATLLSG